MILLGSGLAQIAFDHARGAGGSLSGGIIALTIGSYYALALTRVLRQRAADAIR